MEPTGDILIGRRCLEGLSGYELIKDLEWVASQKQWMLRFQLTISIGEGSLNFIPNVSRWFVLIDHSYPNGRIDIYPAMDGGLTATFQHQSCNLPSENDLWRKGKLCLHTGLRSFARRGYDSEPLTAPARLFWHVKRCVEWLELAELNQLSVAGEPLELPDYPIVFDGSVAFLESEISYSKWLAAPDSSGLVVMKRLNSNPKILYVTSYLGRSNKSIIEVQWGDGIDRGGSPQEFGIWVLLKDIIVMDPWQAPITWKDLFYVATNQAVDLRKLLADLYYKSGKNKPTFVLLGFPIPSKVGGETEQIHWLALYIGKPNNSSGFRPNSPQFAKASAERLFQLNGKLGWLKTENWDRGQITSRGRLPQSIADLRILVIGAGALGSIVAELLTRTNCTQIRVMDKDVVEIGNLARHVLTLDDLGNNKSEALAKHLNKLSPTIKAKSQKGRIANVLNSKSEFLKDFDLIIDTTGSDQVLYDLARASFSEESILASFSLGLHARRLFGYITPFHSQIDSEFSERMNKWMLTEKEDYELEDELPREGLGCWHPLFPARADDIWMLASIAVKTLEDFILLKKSSTYFSVFEQQREDNHFIGIKRMDV